MAERVCIRGCGVRDAHFAVCPDFGGNGPGDCRGCVPVAARDGALICDRCFTRAQRHLEDVADLVGSLRSKGDPMKSTWNLDRQAVSSSRVELPAPIAADLLDASNDIVQGLRAWALLVQFGDGHPWRAEHLEAGITPEDAFEDADGCARVILEAFDRLANDARLIGPLCAFLNDKPGDQWTVAGALAKWPLDDRERWATRPCPECDTRTVRVKPPRGERHPARFRCTTCGWAKSERDDDGLWSEVFADDVHARAIPLGDEQHTTAHDPRWLTLADASRLAKRTPSTVRGWADKGEIRTEAGRYWRDDVESARDERDGAAAPAA